MTREQAEKMINSIEEYSIVRIIPRGIEQYSAIVYDLFENAYRMADITEAGLLPLFYSEDYNEVIEFSTEFAYRRYIDHLYINYPYSVAFNESIQLILSVQCECPNVASTLLDLISERRNDNTRF